MGAPIRLRLRVSPRANRSAVIGRHGEAWKLRVTAAPERDRGNDAVVALLAQTLELRPEAVAIVSGRASRDKVATLVGIQLAEVDRRLAAAAAGAAGVP